MPGSFSASLSGLNANQQKLSVIGNNLANINTVGFKASTVTFADLVSQSRWLVERDERGGVRHLDQPSIKEDRCQSTAEGDLEDRPASVEVSSPAGVLR